MKHSHASTDNSNLTHYYIQWLTFSSWVGLWPLAMAFFPLRQKKSPSHCLCLGHFWCSVVTSVILLVTLIPLKIIKKKLSTKKSQNKKIQKNLKQIYDFFSSFSSRNQIFFSEKNPPYFSVLGTRNSTRAL